MSADIAARKAAHDSVPPTVPIALPPSSGSTPPSPSPSHFPSAPCYPTSQGFPPPEESGAPCTPPHPPATPLLPPSSTERLLRGVSDQALAGVGEPVESDEGTPRDPPATDDMDVDVTCHGAPSPGSPSPGDLPTPSATPTQHPAAFPTTSAVPATKAPYSGLLPTAHRRGETRNGS